MLKKLAADGAILLTGVLCLFAFICIMYSLPIVLAQSKKSQCPEHTILVGTEQHRDPTDRIYVRPVCLRDDVDTTITPHVIPSLDRFRALYGRYVVPSPENVYLYHPGETTPYNGGPNARATYPPRRP